MIDLCSRPARTAMATLSLSAFTATTLACAASVAQEEEPRARDLGIPFEGTPGELNPSCD